MKSCRNILCHLLWGTIMIRLSKPITQVIRPSKPATKHEWTATAKWVNCPCEKSINTNRQVTRPHAPCSRTRYNDIWLQCTPRWTNVAPPNHTRQRLDTPHNTTHLIIFRFVQPPSNQTVNNRNPHAEIDEVHHSHKSTKENSLIAQIPRQHLFTTHSVEHGVAGSNTSLARQTKRTRSSHHPRVAAVAP